MPDTRSGKSLSPIVSVFAEPVPYGTFGHYRVTHRCAVVNLQAANSRLFSLRNSHASNLLAVTRLFIKWLQTGAHTAAIEDSLDIFKLTGFSVSDTVNVVTPPPSVKRTTAMAAAPGAAEIRGVTVAGAAAGMTGGTMTKDTNPFAQLPQWLLLALPTAAVPPDARLDAEDDVNGTHPFVLLPNEGFEIENRVLLGAAASSSVYVDCSWAELAAGTY